MRLLEILIIVLLIIRFLVGIKKSSRWLDWLSIVTLVVTGTHLWIEGYRWQMIPAYAAVLWMSFLANVHLLRRTTPKSISKKRTIWLGVGFLVLLAITTLPPLLLPVPEIYQTDGPYQVGTISLMLVDRDREEIYAEQPGEPRRLMVQFWYPADPTPGESFGPWVEDPDVLAPAISEFLGFPAFFLDHLTFADGHSYPDAPLSEAKERYPLLVFSHGWSGFRAQNTFQMVALASQGYVVAAPDHAYGAIASIFPDGAIAYNNPNALPSGKKLPEDEFMTAAHLLGDQWSGDLSFIVDSLQEIDPESDIFFFQDHLDFNIIGALGHSTGGGAALQFCALDSRCQAVLGMDPYMDPVSPEAIAQGIDVPVMGMFSEGRSFRSGDNLDQFEQMRSNSSGKVYRFEIKGTAHYDFSDLPSFSPLASAFRLKGPLQGARASKIITDYTLAFFGHHLLGTEGEILSGGSTAYPEVIWK